MPKLRVWLIASRWHMIFNSLFLSKKINSFVSRTKFWREFKLAFSRWIPAGEPPGPPAGAIPGSSAGALPGPPAGGTTFQSGGQSIPGANSILSEHKFLPRTVSPGAPAVPSGAQSGAAVLQGVLTVSAPLSTPRSGTGRILQPFFQNKQYIIYDFWHVIK